jgi:hypothetical protein
MAEFDRMKGNPYGARRTRKEQAPAEPQADQATKDQDQPTKWYRFNMKLPAECQAYLQEMAWRNRTTITQYLQDMVMADMAAHPEWRDSLDELNK